MTHSREKQSTETTMAKKSIKHVIIVGWKATDIGIANNTRCHVPTASAVYIMTCRWGEKSTSRMPSYASSTMLIYRHICVYVRLQRCIPMRV